MEFFIGVILGLMGGGGSILTVPLLVYIAGINPIIATAYSLFTVGTTSAVGSIQNYYKKNIVFSTGLIIALPSFIAVYATRRYILPALPDTIFQSGGLILSKNTFIMILFAIIMLIAALSMLTRKIRHDEDEPEKMNYLIAIPSIAVAGLFMGLVGAGGGFIIIPMLVFLGGLSMRKAIGTSLLIIAINSLTGFMGDIQTINIEWDFLLPFTMISVFGIFAGTYLHRFVNERQLKRGFGWFVLLMAIFILIKEISVR